MNQNTITEETAEKLVGLLSKTPGVYHIRKSQIAAGFTATTGLVIFALGIQTFIQQTLSVKSPIVEILIGVILLLISGLLIKKLI